MGHDNSFSPSDDLYQTSVTSTASLKSVSVIQFSSELTRDGPKEINPTESTLPSASSVPIKPCLSCADQQMERGPTGQTFDYKNTSLQFVIEDEALRRRYTTDSTDSTGDARKTVYSMSIYNDSSGRDKRRMAFKTLSIVTGLSYATFLVVFAAIIFVAAPFMDFTRLPQIYCITLIIIGLVYFVFLYNRIRRHTKKIQAREKDAMNVDSCNSQISEVNGATTTEPHAYCFVTGRHGEFFYLKMGAACFCIGLTIHSTLILCYQIIFLVSEDPKYIKCASIETLILEFLFPLYALFVLFFVFKYCNIVINEHRSLARLGLMHSIGTALAFWIFTIVRETIDAIHLKQYYYNNGKNNSNSSGSSSSSSSSSEEETYGTRQLSRAAFITTFNETSQKVGPDCPTPESFNFILRYFSPYLYPFVIEFCIIMAGIFYMMWSNVGQCPDRTGNGDCESLNEYAEFHDLVPSHHDEKDRQSGHRQSTSNMSVSNLAHETDNRNSNVIRIDCQSSYRGIFGGMMMFTTTIVVIFLMFISSSEEHSNAIGLTVAASYDIIVITIMLIATVYAYRQTIKLDINPHHISLLDDILLFIAIPAFFAQFLLSLLPAIDQLKFFNASAALLELVQSLVQTPWIIDGLRRCSNSKENLKTKPGRGLVTFLTAANVTVWIYHTFAVKSLGGKDERYLFYGDIVWTILSHVFGPLIMFYRFHSSVCLVDIWKHAYEPSVH